MSENIQKNNHNVSYAQLAQQFQFPTKEQAIIMDSIDGVTVQEYTLAIGKIVGPANIRFVSRISQSRVCLYLSSKDYVDKIIEEKTKVNIGQHRLEIRRLISNNKRVILSNVCPVIPHHILLEEIKKLGINPTSQISFVRAGLNEQGYSHVLSFRRQLYIPPDDVSKLPPSIQLAYDDTTYWIYTSAEKLTCFLCKEEGHVAKFCKENRPLKGNSSLNVLDNAVKENQPSNAIAPTTSKSLLVEKTQGMPNMHDGCYKELMPPPIGVKRAHSSSTSTTSVVAPSNKIDEAATEKKIKKVLKKTKNDKQIASISVENIHTQIEPAKEYLLANAKKYPISLDGLVDFLYVSYDNSNMLETAVTYTEEISALSDMLNDAASQDIERKLKSRIKRIIKRLKERSIDQISCSSDDVYLNEELMV